jgi:hypothetical protein
MLNDDVLKLVPFVDGTEARSSPEVFKVTLVEGERF